MQVSKLLAWGLTLALFGSVVSAQDIRLKDRKTRWRFTGEYFAVDAHENLGLVGAHYDLLEPFAAVPNLYLGVGGYGAMVGQRGGLFAGGLTAGYLREVAPGWVLDAGLFAGGGGGGVGGTGGDASGLMLRPHLAIERAFPLYALRLEVANTDFLDDEIDDLHFAIGISLPSEVLDARESRRGPEIPAKALVKRRLRFSPLLSEYYLPSELRRVSGGRLRSDLQTTGFGVDYFLGRHVYVPIEAHAATGGGVSGFGMALTGFGFSLPLGFRDRLSLELAGLAGAGGGGDVNTGGGFLWQARGGLKIPLYGPLSLSLSYGATEAVKGDFEARVATVGLTWSSHIPELAVGYPRSRLGREGLSKDTAKINTTRLQVFDKMYVPAPKARHVRGGAYDQTLHLLGVGFEQPISESFAVTGRVYTAWEGDIGGYVEGLFGLKYEFTPFPDERHHFFVSGEAGAGGGGDMDLGSGFIYQDSAGYRYDISERVSLSASVGSMQPNQGSFDSEMYQIGVTWNLHRAFLK